MIRSLALPPATASVGSARIEDLLFRLDLTDSGLIWDGSIDVFLFNGRVDPKTGQLATAPSGEGPHADWQRDESDPDRASNSATRQNAVYDHGHQQWIDAATGQPLSPSLK